MGKLDEEKKKELSDLIDERITLALSKTAMPDGYTKCKKCGKIILKENIDTCPYCIPSNDTTPDNTSDDDDFL